MTVIALCVGTLFLIVVIEEGRHMVKAITTWHHNRAIVQQNQTTPRIEERNPMEARLVETMPSYLDPNDPRDVEAWKKSRSEVVNPKRSSDE